MVIRIAAAVALLAGCELLVHVPDGELAAPDTCARTRDCSAPTPLCDTASATCVECFGDSDCPGERPLCDHEACRTCADDAECASDVCMPDGSCAAVGSVLYAATDGTGSTCLATEPCTLDTAVTLLSPALGTIKLAPGTYERTAELELTASVLITGAGATLHDAAGPGVPMLVAHAAALALDRIVVDGDAGIGVQCVTGGALALDRVTIPRGVAGVFSDGCITRIDRTSIANQTMYGVYINGGTATVTSSYIVHNGGADGSTGGLVLAHPTAATIEFTTIAGNVSTTQAGGLTCTEATIAVVHDDIIWGNSIDPACVISYSDVDPAYTTGTTSIAIDPMFVAPPTDYHLAPGSPVRGTADPSAPAGLDYDGEVRPMPAATAPDPGADEIP